MTQTLAHQADHLPVKGTGAKASVRVLQNLLVALAYFLTAPLGQLLAIPPGNVTPVWIPSGIILAAVLVWGRRVWPGIFLGAFAGNVWVYLDTSSFENVARTLFSGTANGVGDALCAVVGAALVKHFAGTNRPFDEGKNVIVFIVCGALTAGVISAAFGVTGLALADFITWKDYANVWITWGVGDVMSIMILTPFLLEWKTWWRNKLTGRQWLEVGAMLTALTFISLYSLEVLHLARIQLPLMILLPLLIPPVFKFHHGVTFLAVLIVSSITVTATALGRGPWSESDLNTGLIEVQLFLWLVTSTIYILTGVVTERKKALQALNETTKELTETQLSLVEAERMRTIGQLASGVAHEVKNPLAIITLGTDFLKRKVAETDTVSKGVLENMQQAIDRADSIVLGLLDFGAPRKLMLENVTVEEMIREAKAFTDHALNKHTVELNFTVPENVPTLQLDRDKCVQVLVNLILNACHAIKSNGQIHLVASVRESNAASVVELVVEDTGPGVPEDVLPRLFQPFFTTKKKEGTGLGLSVSRMIMHMHDGDLTAENRGEGGARFRMTWPLKRTA